MPCGFNGCYFIFRFLSLLSGSSVDLTRALLSIYDKFLNVNEDDVQQQTETCCTDKGDPESICPEPAMYQSDQQTSPSLLSSSSSSSPPPPPASSLAAAAAVDEQQNDKPDFDQTDAAASHTTNLCASATLDNAALDSRKRPLSISSMSSASSSSLPRHSRYKRLNMTDTEIVINGNNQNIVSGPTIIVDNTDMDSVVSSEYFIDTVSVSSSSDGAVRGFEEDQTSASDQSTICRKLTIGQHEEEEDSMTSSSYSSPSHAQDDNGLKYQSNEREKSCSPVPTLHELTDNECKQSLPDEDGEEVTDIHSTSLSHYVSYTERVVSEIVETERTYVKSLKEIKEVSELKISFILY